jgi:predicted transglutaminase-like cysteine proteinase
MRDTLFGRVGTWPLLSGWLHSITLAVALMPAGGSEAQTLALLPPPSGSVATGNHPIAPVPGWFRFCQQRPDECVVNPAEPATITLTSQAWETLTRVNRQVNAAIRPMTDREHWGVEDIWGLADDGYGDCEDYQLLKRKLLRERGLPQRAMRMTVVIDELNEGHAVLMIRTDRGDYILDNKTNAVLPWDETGYVYVKREGHDSMAWTSLGGVTSPTATANR